MQFMDWSPIFVPYTVLAWTGQCVNLHIALKAMFYLLINIKHTQLMFITLRLHGKEKKEKKKTN